MSGFDISSMVFGNLRDAISYKNKIVMSEVIPIVDMLLTDDLAGIVGEYLCVDPELAHYMCYMHDTRTYMIDTHGIKWCLSFKSIDSEDECWYNDRHTCGCVSTGSINTRVSFYMDDCESMGFEDDDGSEEIPLISIWNGLFNYDARHVDDPIWSTLNRQIERVIEIIRNVQYETDEDVFHDVQDIACQLMSAMRTKIIKRAAQYKKRCDVAGCMMCAPMTI